MKKGRIELSVGLDIIEWKDQHGGAKKTDWSRGKVNLSQEVENYIRNTLMAPRSVGYALAREKEELSHRLEEVDRRCQDLLGYSTIEEWMAHDLAETKSHEMVVAKQGEIRKQITDEQLEKLIRYWSHYLDNSRVPSQRQKVSWLKTRLQDFPALNLTPEQFLEKYDDVVRQRTDSPEVG